MNDKEIPCDAAVVREINLIVNCGAKSVKFFIHKNKNVIRSCCDQHSGHLFLDHLRWEKITKEQYILSQVFK